MLVGSSALVAVGPAHAPNGSWRIRATRVSRYGAIANSTHGIAVTIPTRRTQRKHPRFNRTLYRERNQVERLFNRFKQFRRVATRYEKRGVNYLAMVTLAAVTMWL